MYVNKKFLYAIYAIFFCCIAGIISAVFLFNKNINEERATIKNQRIMISLQNGNNAMEKKLTNLSNKIILIVDEDNFSFSETNSLHENIIINVAEEIFPDQMLASNRNKNYLIELFFTKNKHDNLKLNYFFDDGMLEQMELKTIKIFNKSNTINGLSFYFDPSKKIENQKLAQLFTVINKNRQIVLFNLNPNFKSQLFSHNLFFNIDYALKINDNFRQKVEKIAEDASGSLIFVHLRNFSFEKITEVIELLAEKKVDIISLRDLQRYIMEE